MVGPHGRLMSFYETAALYGLIALGIYACAWVVMRVLRGRQQG